MKKITSMILTLSMAAGLVTAVPAETSAAEAVKTTVLEKELYRLDFDDLTVSEEGTYNGTGELIEKYGSNVSVGTPSGNEYSVTIGADEDNSGDKYIKFTQNAKTQATKYIYLTMPEAIKSGVYRLSYDVKWTGSNSNGPFIRTKSYHYQPGSLDLWGPNLSMIGPHKADNAQMYATFGKSVNGDGLYVKYTGDELNNPITNNEWHNVDMVFDANTKNVLYYYDGVCIGTVNDSSYSNLVFSGATQRFQLQIYHGWQSWNSVMIDNISFTKEETVPVQLAGAMRAAVSADGRELAITSNNAAGVTSAKVINAKTGENIAQSITASKNKVYIKLKSAVDAASDYCIYLDSSSGRQTGYIKQSSNERIAKKFDFSNTDGVTVTPVNGGQAAVKDSVLKITGSAKGDGANAVLSLGDGAIPAGASFEVSYDYNAVSSYTVMDASLANDSSDWFVSTLVTRWRGMLNALRYVNNPQNAWWDNTAVLTEGIQPNQWYTVRAVFDAEAKKIDYYLGDTYKGSVSAENCLVTVGGYRPLADGITQIKLNGEYAGDATGLDIAFDNVTVKLISSDVEIHSIDWAGNDLFFAKTMDRPISSFNIKDAKTAALKKDGAEVAASGSLDSNTGIYTLTPDTMIKNGDYTLVIDGISYDFTIDPDIQQSWNVISLQLNDSDGNEIKGTNDVLAGDTVSANATIYNGYVDDKSVTVGAAVYNGNKLIGVNTDTRTIGAGAQSTIPVSVAVSSIDNLKLKAFVWETESLKPLCGAEVCDAPFDYARLYQTVTFDSSSFDSIPEGAAVTDGTFQYAKGVNAAAMKTFDKAVSEEVLHLSFDYKPTSYLNFFWIRLIGGGSTVQLFSDRGAMAYYPDTQKWDISDKRIGYTPGDWYDVDIYADFVGRMIYYYQNGTLIGSTEFKGADGSYNQVEFRSENGDVTYLDNIVIEQLSKRDSKLPKEVKEKVAVDISTDAMGRILFDKDNASFNVTVQNKKNIPCEYTINYFVYDEQGNTVANAEDNIALAAMEKKSFAKTLVPASYGFFSVKAIVTDNEGKTVSQSVPYEFSVCRAPEDGVVNSEMGVQLTSTTGIDLDPMTIHKQLPLISKLGFTFTRGQNTGFGGWNTETNSIDFSDWTAGIYNTAKENGIELFHIMGGTNDAFTKNGKVQNPPTTNDAIAAFAASAVAACDKYKEIYEHSPADLDVWNEYWMTNSNFNPDNAQPSDYASLLIATYNAVKEKHPDTKVWGLSGVGMKTESFDPWDAFAWTQEVLEWIKFYNQTLGTSSMYMDGISMHPYTDWKNPEDGDPAGMVKAYRDLFASYGFNDVPIIASEWGWASGGSDGDASRLPNEQEQAAYFVRANVINKANNLFDKVTWYGSSDVSNDDTNRQNNYGLIRGAFDVIGYEAKPQCLTAGAYMSLMTGAEYIDTVGISDQVKLYRFRPRGSSGNDYIFVLWAKDSAQTVNIKFETENNAGMTFIDKYGNESHLSGDGNNVYTLNLGIDPCYLRGNVTSFVVQ